MRRLGTLLAIGAAASAVCTTLAETPVTAGFTYQGLLEDGGSPVSGPFDFQFRLYDAAAGGLQVGGTITIGDLGVSDGLFTTSLNFGSTPFAGNARWLEIGVRPGASVGAYTILTPRQPLAVTPYALHALSDANWEAVGANIMNRNSGFVGINRSAPLSGAEYFGIQAPATTTNYGGMYIRTDSDQAKPFYGYRAGAGSTAWTYLDGANGDWRVFNGTDRLVVQSNGEVGIGVADPAAKLDITDSAGVALRVSNTGTGYCAQFLVNGATDTAAGIYSATYGGGAAGSFEAHNTNNTAALNAYKNGGPALRCISTLSTPGTAATDCVVSIVGGTDTELTGGGFLVLGSVVGANISIDNNEIEARNNGLASTLTLNNDGGDTVISPQGTTRVRVLEITGADLAEKFPVSDAVKPKPGMVVMIDAANPGKLCLAQGAYNKKVAGVVSGANNFAAGTILGNLPGSEDAPAVALSGRVWVHCDASTQAIEVGDMLTTSDTPGHAMSAADGTRSHGAVIGKAMTALKQGEKGMVLVLVNLQ
jgi:hypothetical protein